jgi:excisionase family DNA binding protein
MMTIKEVAELLNVHEKTVRRRINTGALPVVRSGRIIRIHPKELNRFLADGMSIQVHISQ